VIFDASAILALLFEEPGAEVALQHLRAEPPAVSAVNMAEAVGKLVDLGVPLDSDAVPLQFVQAVVPFTAEQAAIAGRLRRETRSLGLSLGDRACLAAAIVTSQAIVTADRAWASLDVGPTIHLVR
jgi:PIN domain nuclease of toxin-antitoxin system